MTAQKHFLSAALIGNPNVGKSTFMNALVGDDVAIVSPLPQTTRKRMEGLALLQNLQVLLLDAPGFVSPQKGLFQALQKESEALVREADVVLAVVSLDEEKWEQVEATLHMAKNSKKPWAVVITKLDLKKFAHRKDRIRFVAREMGAQEIVEFSEKRAPRWSALEEFFRAQAKAVEKFPYDSDALTRQNLRDLVPEWIREQCFLQLKGEIPYGTAVSLREFTEGARLTRIEADLWVRKENHKKIVIGAKGQKLKSIGSQARHKIEKYLGQKTFLGLHVVVKDRWDTSSANLKDLGFEV